MAAHVEQNSAFGGFLDCTFVSPLMLEVVMPFLMMVVVTILNDIYIAGQFHIDEIGCCNRFRLQNVCELFLHGL